MKELIVLSLNKSNYTLGQDNIKLTEITILHDKLKLKEGTKIYMHEELLDNNYVEYSPHYYFGDINAVYGRNVQSANDIDVIMIVLKNEKIFLKRFYG